MSIYTDEQLAAFEARLRALAADIDAQMGVYTESSKPVSPDEPIGRLTRQDAMQEQQMAKHLRERLEKQRIRVITALERLQNGTYGVCVMCKEPIHPDRLALMPEAPACAPCLERHQQGRR
jgi:DnaK suppressor protein